MNGGSGVSGRTSGVFAGMLGLLLPRGCAGCDRPDETLCPSCRDLFDRVIALPFPAAVTGYAYAGAVYGGNVRRAILAWKDHGDEECDREFARCIVALARRSLPIEGVALDGALLVVPAPSSARSLAERGRRHLMPLAKAIAAYYRSSGLDARVEPALQIAARVVDGKAVETAGADQRASRMGGRLTVRNRSLSRVAGRTVVIVDDIVTTGATMRACAAALETAGARVLAGLALAATPRYDSDSPAS
ncbi:ComF family protein [Bifidobacterium callitrichos]|uniref:ComF family protein n=1 Tax=Bifidobacterium callitrichos TaxID=762209 RepID=A0A5M9ZB64_9BIFI|nr:phosphoribosyltransferase family protein [Bifidobacterium callitrichos]KAA8815835.1 ComF family protein [Bifidobacterium callitrichos]